MVIDVSSLTVIGVALGGLLGTAARFLAVEENPLEAEIKAMLPGSQCGQCGHVGCAQAAAALAKGEAPVTLCPPGGKAVAEALAKKLGVTADLSEMKEKRDEYAHVNEDLCIGCMRCRKECSVDAIVGASRQIHSVITDFCHGCGKCVDICPTEAVRMLESKPAIAHWHWPKPALGQSHASH